VSRIAWSFDDTKSTKERVHEWRDDVFQDWNVNRGTRKSQVVLALFRQAARWHRGPSRPWRPLLIAAYTFLVSWILGVELLPGTDVGPGLRIFSPQTIIINVATRIGAACTIHGTTVLGNIERTDGTITGSPWIRDGVELGPGVIIIGPVEVGARARIGAGSVVTKSVPAGAVAVGNPARVIEGRIEEPAEGTDF
jgi:serine acetyltransferase